MSIHDAEEVSRLLVRKGVATFISGKRSFRIPIGSGGAPAVGLWVVLDDQYRDAKLILSNPSYEPSKKLTTSEIAAIRSQVKNPDQSVVLRFLFSLLGIVLAASLAIFWLTRG